MTKPIRWPAEVRPGSTPPAVDGRAWLRSDEYLDDTDSIAGDGRSIVAVSSDASVRVTTDGLTWSPTFKTFTGPSNPQTSRSGISRRSLSR